MTWWLPSRHADRRPLLIARNRIKAALRAWFEGQGFTEVEPAALCVSPGNETHLHAFATEMVAENGARTPRYLHTSPEFAMKKLLAAGETRIFAFAPVWRNREQGSPLHAAEFTMLEWYRAGAPYQTLFDDCAALLREAARAAGSEALRWRERTCNPFAALEELSVADAFTRYADMDLLPSPPRGGEGGRRPDEGAGRRIELGSRHSDSSGATPPHPSASPTPSPPHGGEGLREACRRIGVRTGADDTWSDLFSRVLVERIEPHLGAGRATILHSYPVAEAALARVSPADPRVAERFELYACGVELANGFGELTDAVEQRARFEADMEEKQRRYGERYPVDEDFLAALAQMPPASGCALGFDRLVMLAAGAPSVQSVLWTPPA